MYQQVIVQLRITQHINMAFSLLTEVSINLVGSSVFGESRVVGVALPLGGAEVNIRWALPV